MLACVGLLPLVVAITLSPTGVGSPVTDDVYHIPKLLLMASLLFVATCAWAVDLVVGSRRLRTGVVQVPLAIFVALVATSTAFGLEPVSSLFGVSGLSTGAITWLSAVWAGVLLAQYAADRRALRQLSWAFVAGGAAVGLIGLLQTAGLDLLGTPLNAQTAWMIDRGKSTLGNPNYAGLYLIVPSIVAVALGLTGESPARRMMGFAAAGVMSAALFVTLTRAAWLGLIFGLLLFLFTAPGAPGSTKRRWGIVAMAGTAVILAGALLVGPSLTADRFSSIRDGVDAFSSGRLLLWSDTLRAVGNRPLLGTGADHLALGIYEIQSGAVVEGADRLVPQDPHSLPLLVAGMFGIPALLALGAYVVWALYLGFALTRKRADAAEKTLVYAAWVAGTAGLVLGSLLSVYTISSVFVLFVSLGVVVVPMLKPIKTGARAPAATAVLGIALAATTLYGAVQGYQAARLMVLAGTGDTQAVLEQAMRIVPWDTRTRTNYVWRKVSAFRPVLQGTDVAAARDAASTLDTQIRLEIERAPRELLWYRMRIDLHRLMKGYPGYQPEMVLEAIDGALEAFPTDTEFNAWKKAALAGTL